LKKNRYESRQGNNKQTNKGMKQKEWDDKVDRYQEALRKKKESETTRE